MVMSEQLEDLSNVFVLLKGIPRALDPVVAAFRKRVSHQGMCVRACTTSAVSACGSRRDFVQLMASFLRT